MKKIFTLMMVGTLAAGIATNTMAKSEKKNVPKNNVVEAALTAAGAVHYPEKMKIGKTGPVEFEETYYHAFSGSLKSGNYRVIIFDNKENYIGYYESEYEPLETEEGGVVLDAGDGESTYTIRFGEKGPREKTSIDGVPVIFVKNEKQVAKAAEAANAAKAEVASNEPIQPEYREWILINRGKKIPVEAIYVKQTGSKVTLKKKSDGRSKEFPLNMLSAEDKEYVKKLK
jgi:hypothetical protein